MRRHIQPTPARAQSTSALVSACVCLGAGGGAGRQTHKSSGTPPKGMRPCDLNSDLDLCWRAHKVPVRESGQQNNCRRPRTRRNSLLVSWWISASWPLRALAPPATPTGFVSHCCWRRRLRGTPPPLPTKWAYWARSTQQRARNEY